ncbi:MAG: beta-glucosidase [Alteromonadaceae bacterium]|nr:MAG: beta-glucosidase [Alteromonadaceae bacterium]
MDIPNNKKLHQRFPDDFVWGVASAAFQVEGAAREGGRGPSIWDAFNYTPGKIHLNQTADIACDHYHRLEEDVAMIAALGVKAYRFSISWSRVLPQGYSPKNAPSRADKSKLINEEGLAFYDRLINLLLENNIQPWVTLFHWDLPLALQMEQDGLLSSEVADYFADYAELCFSRYGDRVKHWITLNEPWCSAMLGHGMGLKAPGRISTEEPYLAAHNLLLAHGKMVKNYRDNFQAQQGGQIGITNNCDWREPKNPNAKNDQAAAQRALEFFLGWFADPIYLGDYPQSMRERVKERLPKFTDEERALIFKSSDFFGLNHYTTRYAEDMANIDKDDPQSSHGNGGISSDQDVYLSQDDAWEETDMGWAVVPWGCRKLLEWIDQRYDHPDIYITENGCAIPEEDDLAKAQNDSRRVEFYETYLDQCAQAIENGVKLKGYFAWTLMDNYEWEEGYSKRFGLYHVDFATGERNIKNSGRWFQALLSK